MDSKDNKFNQANSQPQGMTRTPTQEQGGNAYNENSKGDLKDQDFKRNAGQSDLNEDRDLDREDYQKNPVRDSNEIQHEKKV